MPANPTTLLLEQQYRDTLLRRALQTVQQINRQFSLVDPENLSSSFHAMTPLLAAMISLGQRDAQVIAQTFLTALSESETGAPVPNRPPSPTVAGTTRDGRGIERVVSSFIPAVFIALRRGVPLQTALNTGRHGVARIAHSEITEAAARETTYQGTTQAQGDLVGWTWVTGGKKPCGACLAQQNGQVRSWSVSMNRHAGCSCVEAPVYSGVREAVRRPTGKDRFDAMTQEQQAATFRTGGEAKAEAIRSGRIDLSDLVQTERHDAWHTTISEKPLSDIPELQDTNTTPKGSS